MILFRHDGSICSNCNAHEQSPTYHTTSMTLPTDWFLHNSHERVFFRGIMLIHLGLVFGLLFNRKKSFYTYEGWLLN